VELSLNNTTQHSQHPTDMTHFTELLTTDHNRVVQRE